MKEKVKKVLKNRIFIFILGGLLFSGISVYAVTYFPSEGVTYDNKESGLSSTDVQGAIDELYNVCKTPIEGGDEILEKEPIVTTGVGLYEDKYEKGRYFYKGRNPNNYITFNNEFAGWRIMSVEKDKTIKIMRTVSIGERYWDTNSYDTASNDWARPAVLNTYLNKTYYNDLTEQAKSQIVAHNFSIGAVSYNSKVLSTQINGENNVKWYGKVALPTVSEYLRASSNQAKCNSFSLNEDNYSTCRATNWIFNNSAIWTLSRMVASESNKSSFFLQSDGSFSPDYWGTYSMTANVHPVVYLSPNITLKGSGTELDPYTIE